MTAVSIITICFNEVEAIKHTCESIVAQSFADFEWIVVDGGSTDGTQDVLAAYRDRMTSYVSEPDRGIYHAMNKGLRRASGDYVLFLNGGDALIHADMLRDIFTTSQSADILYGDIELPPGKTLPDGTQPESLKGMHITRWLLTTPRSLHHQATFVRRTLYYRFGLHDDTYKYAADFEWFVRAFTTDKKLRWKNLNRVISIFDPHGASQNPANAPAIAAEARKALGLHIKTYPVYRLLHGVLHRLEKMRKPEAVKKAPEILIDISVCGQALQNKKASTGVWRVIDNMVRHTLAHPVAGAETKLVSVLGNYTPCRDYLQSAQIAPARFGFLQTWENILALFDRVAYALFQKAPPHFYVAANRAMRIMLQCLRPVAARFMRMPPQIVHYSYYPPLSDAGQNQKRVFTVYDLIPVLYPQWLQKNMAQDHPVQKLIKQLRADDHVLCISEATKRDLLQQVPQLNPDNVAVIPLGVSDNFYPCHDTDKISAMRKKYGIGSVPYILSLCTLEPRKNIPHLVTAFCEWAQQNRSSDVQLVLAGGKGWRIDDFLQRMQDVAPALKQRIVFTGFVDDADLAALYSGALMFAYPSLYEGFGLPPLEAMACGTPVVTSDNSSLPEVVGDAGLMVPATDRAALLKAFDALYHDGALRDELRRRGFAQAEKFNWARAGEVAHATYEKILRGMVS